VLLSTTTELFIILATRLVIASTGAMLTVGHQAPWRISALACRIESKQHTGKERDSRQVSGTSDASKTQVRLTGSWRRFYQLSSFVSMGPSRYAEKKPMT
jgi:hypothetical protein